MISSADFRHALSQLGTAVTIITSDGDAGRYGMTASAVCSVTDDPPTLLLCLNRASQANSVIKQNGRFCVNVLHSGQEALSRFFSDRALSIDERFEQEADWVEMDGGAPGLASALAAILCDVESVVEAGTHSVFFGRAKQAMFGEEGHGLIYFGRAYHRLGGITQ